MDAGVIGSLVNLGSAGAVIIVVMIFLKSIKERDAEWRDFFTELNRQNCEDGERRMALTEKIAELVQTIITELHDHDSKVDARIKQAQLETAQMMKDAVREPVTQRRKAQ